MIIDNFLFDHFPIEVCFWLFETIESAFKQKRPSTTRTQVNYIVLYRHHGIFYQHEDHAFLWGGNPKISSWFKFFAPSVYQGIDFVRSRYFPKNQDKSPIIGGRSTVDPKEITAQN